MLIQLVEWLKLHKKQGGAPRSRDVNVSEHTPHELTSSIYHQQKITAKLELFAPTQHEQRTLWALP